ncbi:MAG TPA: anthranilate phosphoribosyltransferase [Terriglobia bacterium]|nr:anthranilate phosphoribosyltransferase [Terriglobia bacterium]
MSEKLEAGSGLGRAEARGVMSELLSGTSSDEEIIRFLSALRDKGETAEEIIGFAEAMRERAAQALREAGVNLEEISRQGPLLDTCGTGGDGKGTFNVSTAAALVAAAAGVRVAKHGNRSISSRCGSADVLSELGVKLDLPLVRIPACLEKVGMVFLYAPHLHLAMKHVMSARRSMKTKTVFNLLGPLTNPLGATLQLVGIYDHTKLTLMAKALAAVGTKRAFVVAAHDGVDEISTTGPTLVTEVDRDEIRTRELLPEEFGLERAPAGALRGGDAAFNADLLKRVLDGESGPCRDTVLANASAALVAAGKADGFRQGVQLAAETIDSRRAKGILEALVEFTRRAQ